MGYQSELRIDFDAITELFTEAEQQGRKVLFEYETYRMLADSGAETPPSFNFIVKGSQPSSEVIDAMPGDKVVLKIVSPGIIHKTEAGGVRIVEKKPEKIRSAMRRMMYEVPDALGDLIERRKIHSPEAYSGLSGDALRAAVVQDIRGILLVQFMPPDSESFGNELIVGIRYTREFGMVISAGLGGTDTELYAERFRKGQAIVTASTAMTDGNTFFEFFKKTISYKKLAGLTVDCRGLIPRICQVILPIGDIGRAW
jgi:succinyl-CoA synthetase beta subunit